MIREVKNNKKEKKQEEKERRKRQKTGIEKSVYKRRLKA